MRQESSSRRQSRPVLVPSIELRDEPVCLNFALQNYGPSAAFDVKVVFDDLDIWRTTVGMPTSVIEVGSASEDRGSTWAPGQRFETIYSWGAGTGFDGALE